MCELFGMSAFRPTTVTFSLKEFSRHGGMTGPHKDGWGIAFYEGKDVRIIKDESSASKSPCLSFVKQHQFKSKIIISHIRRATQGEISYSNTQPFQREIAGRMHTFAHNGDLKGINSSPIIKPKRYSPVGETDSEYVFCYLAELLSELWCSDLHPTIEQRFTLISHFADIISGYGPANFVYSDGELLFAHGHVRTQKGREGVHPPGLYTLCRSRNGENATEDIRGVYFIDRTQQQEITLIASVPLTNEQWKPMAEGDIVVLKDGKPIKIA